MKIALYYLLPTVLFLILTFISSHWMLQLLFGWIALSLFIVSSAYWLNSASIFRKRSNGSLPWYSRWLFIPIFVFSRGYNFLARRYDKVPPIQRITNKVYLGARLIEDDIPQLNAEGITAVLDVTAEFAALDWATSDEGIQYLNIPILDHAIPTDDQLSQAVRWLHAQQAGQKKILVHCALGRGRSVLVLAAYLFSQQNSRSAEQAVALIKAVRVTARLNKRQLKALRQFAADYQSRHHIKACLIANPVSGAGKWEHAQEEIIELLSPYMSLTVQQTSPEICAQQLALQAKQNGTNLIIACGGDGTVSEVASELVNTDIRLGIIPLGTTNALSHALWGISAKLMPIRSACLNIIEGQSQAIDTAQCNQQLVLLLAGIGFAQQMIASADRERKNQLGQLAYLDGLWRAVQISEVQHLTVQFDDLPAQVIETSSLIVANAAPATTVLAQGKGMPNITDGQLDVTWLKNDLENQSAIGSLAELAFVGLTQITLDGNVQHCLAKRVQISAEHEINYVIDGELHQADKLDISIMPASLYVMLPVTSLPVSDQ